MKEVTMITTCEITTIANVEDEDITLLANADKKISEFIKDDLGADHVQILKNQVFVRDLPVQSDAQ